MKNFSIRTRILTSLVVVNLLGMIVVMIYLHGSYSRSLDTTIANTGTQGLAAWEEISTAAGVTDPIAMPKETAAVLDSMKKVTGADYVLLLDKEATDKTAFSAARQALGEPSSWEEGDVYAPFIATSDEAAGKATFDVAPGDVPENSRVIGVEVGSCTKTCHESVTGDGDYWAIRWSSTSASFGHAVFPVYTAADDPIGVIYAIEDISEQANAANTSMIQTMLTVGFTLLVATLLIGMMLDILVLRRLAKMTTSIQEISMRVAGGDFNAHYEPDGSTDEIGSFEKFFSDFISLVSRTLKQLSGQK